MTVPDLLLQKLADSTKNLQIECYDRSVYNCDRIIAEFAAAATFDLYPQHSSNSDSIAFPFGEGCSSFFHLFIYLKDGRSTHTLSDNKRVKTIIDGIVFEIHRHAPIATYRAEKSITVYQNGAFESGTAAFARPYFPTLDTLPAGNWQSQLQEATHILNRHGIFILNGMHFELALKLSCHPEMTAADLYERWFNCDL